MNKSYTYQSETEIMHLAEQERAKVIGEFFKNLFKKQKTSYSEIKTKLVMGGYKESKN
jgi:hypothetical protein